MGKLLPSPDPGDETPLPLTTSTWTESVLHTNCRMKKKSKQLLYPKICGQSQQRRGRRPGGTSEFWSNFQTKAAERSRGQAPRFEVLMRIAQSTALSGQVAPLFLLGLRAGVPANPTPSIAFSGSVPPGPVPQSAGLCLGAEPKAFPPESKLLLLTVSQELKEKCTLKTSSKSLSLCKEHSARRPETAMASFFTLAHCSSASAARDPLSTLMKFIPSLELGG